MAGDKTDDFIFNIILDVVAVSFCWEVEKALSVEDNNSNFAFS